MFKRIITNPKFIVERDGDNWVLKFKDGKIYKPIEFNNAQLSGKRNAIVTNPNFSIEFNDGVPSLLVNIDGVNVNVSNYVAPQPPTPPVPPVPTDRILYTVVEGGTQPTSTWITTNCSDNVFDAETGEGYLVLNEDVTTIECPGDDEQEIYPNMFDDSGEDSNIATVVIPTQITSIGYDAFSCCASLTSITIPNSVTSIGNYVFSDCTGLTSVTIPDSVTSIGEGAFYDCTGLASVTIPNGITGIGESAFSGCTGLASVTIPNGITGIGESAFSGCTGLTSVTIPDSVTSIGEGAFSGCTSLTSVTIPNSVTSIGVDAFAGCAGLTSVTIPNSVISIGERAFNDCGSLASVTIPNSVASIGRSAFENCRNLASVTCFATTPPTLGTDVFHSIDTTTCGVPSASIQAYKDDASWAAAFTTFVAADMGGESK